MAFRKIMKYLVSKSWHKKLGLNLFLLGLESRFLDADSMFYQSFCLKKNFISTYIWFFHYVSHLWYRIVDFTCHTRMHTNYPTQALDGLVLTGQELHDILNEIDLSYNGRLELADYFQVIIRATVWCDAKLYATENMLSLSVWVCAIGQIDFIPHNHLKC